MSQVDELDEQEVQMGVLTGQYPLRVDSLLRIDGRWVSCDYSVLAAAIGDIVLEGSAGDYQGTTYFVLRRGPYVGLLEQSYGSCSGCDWAQSCSTPEDWQELFDAMRRETLWFDDPADVLEYLESRVEREEWRDRELVQIIEQVRPVLDAV